MYTLYYYPKCSTCKKAVKWLDSHQIKYKGIHIVTDTPDARTIKQIHESSGLPIGKLLNTSGKRYRDLGLKDQLQSMMEEEVYKLLATDGMLIKRPIITKKELVLIGFNETLWNDLLF
jgi:arsenate reductase